MERAAVKSDTSPAAAKAVANQPKSVKSEGTPLSDLPTIQFRFREKVTSVAPIIQPKLTVGQPNDKYEQEADAVADKVMTMPEPASIQRSCSACRDREIQTKPLFATITPLLQRTQIKELSFAQRAVEDEEELVHTKVDTPGEHIADSSIEGSIDHTSGHRSPLHSETRSFMEGQFGADFSNVRIHNNSNSIQLNKELNAQAFTRGTDIYFNQGKYSPESSQGKHLLAHELTHVVQQTGTGNAGSSINTYQCDNPINQNKIQRTSEIPDETIPGLEPVTGETVPALGGHYPGIPEPETCEPPEDMDCDGTESSTDAVNHTYIFPQNSAILNSTQQAEIDVIASSLNATSGSEDIRIDGYASAEGACTYNWRLSCDRAHAIANELQNPSNGTPGISISNIQLFAHGETNEFGRSLASNRKGTITILVPIIPPPVPIPVPTPTPTPTPACPTWEQYIGPVLASPNSLWTDIGQCFCLGVRITDLLDDALAKIPGAGVIFGNDAVQTAISAVDCVCSVYDLLQLAWQLGTDPGPCYSIYNYSRADLGRLTAMTAAVGLDCGSSIIAEILTGWIQEVITSIAAEVFGAGGPHTAAGGALLGYLIGEAFERLAQNALELIFDILSEIAENYLTYGTPFPLDACRACTRLGNRIHSSIDPSLCERWNAAIPERYRIPEWHNPPGQTNNR